MSALEDISSHLENDPRCIVNEDKQKLYVYMRSLGRKPGEGKGVFAIISEDAPGTVSINTSALKDGKTLRSSGIFGVDSAKQFLSNMSVSKLAEREEAKTAKEKEKQVWMHVTLKA